VLTIALGALIPAVLTCVLALAGKRIAAKASATVQASIAPISCAAGVLAGYVVIRGWPAWPMADATATVAYLAIVACGVAIALNALRPPDTTARKLLSLAIVLIAFAPFLWRMTRSLRMYEWSDKESALWLAGLSAGVALLWWSVDELYKRARGPRPEVILTTVASAGWVVLHQSGSALLGQLSGTLAAAMAGLTIATIACPARLRRGTSVVFAMVFAALLINGHLLAELSPTAGLLLIFCPVAFLIVGWIRRRGA
jgi:hypothetical protein